MSTNPGLTLTSFWTTSPWTTKRCTIFLYTVLYFYVLYFYVLYFYILSSLLAHNYWTKLTMISNKNKLQIKTGKKNTINFHCPFFIWSKCKLSFLQSVSMSQLFNFHMLPVYIQPPLGSYTLALWLVLTHQPKQIWSETWTNVDHRLPHKLCKSHQHSEV